MNFHDIYRNGYGMGIFSKVSNHIQAIVVDLVEQVEHQANLVPTIVAKTLRF